MYVPYDSTCTSDGYKVLKTCSATGHVICSRSGEGGLVDEKLSLEGELKDLLDPHLVSDMKTRGEQCSDGDRSHSWLMLALQCSNSIRNLTKPN